MFRDSPSFTYNTPCIVVSCSLKTRKASFGLICRRVCRRAPESDILVHRFCRDTRQRSPWFLQLLRDRTSGSPPYRSRSSAGSSFASKSSRSFLLDVLLWESSSLSLEVFPIARSFPSHHFRGRLEWLYPRYAQTYDCRLAMNS
jgi:hypothetical protein